MPLPAGLTREELEREVLEAAWRARTPLLPDTVLTLDDGWWQVRTPSLTQGGMNEIAYVRVDERDIDARLDRAIEEFRGSKFRFVVDGGTRPGDLPQRLEKRGFTRSASKGVAR